MHDMADDTRVTRTRRRLGCATLLALVAAAACPSLAAAAPILVQRVSGLDAARRSALRAHAGVRFERTATLEASEIVSAPAGHVDAALAALNADPDVRFAMPDIGFRLADAATDYYSRQWGLNSDENADINAPEAWRLSTGAGVTVAIVDTGVDATHPDLAGHIRGNGYDYVQDDTTPQDENGHGTETAGLVAASRDGAGITGAAPDSTILPLRVSNAAGVAQFDDILSAFDKAGAMGVRIVSASLASDPLDPNSQTARDVAQLLDATFAKHPETLYVVPAGNNDSNDDARPVYPCGSTAENLICVGAHTEADKPADFSNWGVDSVDLFAPGVNIYTTTLGGGWFHFDGTSFAAPLVAAEAALLLARVPRLSAAALKDLILSTSYRSDLYAPRSVTGGRADAYAALLEAVRDTDADGTQDVIDACPTVAASTADGCPPGPIATPTPTPVVTPQPAAPGQGGESGGATTTPAEAPRVRSLTATVTRCHGAGACRRTATLKLTPDRAARVTLRVERKDCKGTRCHWTLVLVKAFAASTRGAKVRTHALRRGTYRVTAVLTSGSVSSRPTTRTFRVR